LYTEIMIRLQSAFDAIEHVTGSSHNASTIDAGVQAPVYYTMRLRACVCLSTLVDCIIFVSRRRRTGRLSFKIARLRIIRAFEPVIVASVVGVDINRYVRISFIRAALARILGELLVVTSNIQRTTTTPTTTASIKAVQVSWQTPQR